MNFNAKLFVLAVVALTGSTDAAATLNQLRGTDNSPNGIGRQLEGGTGPVFTPALGTATESSLTASSSSNGGTNPCPVEITIDSAGDTVSNGDCSDYIGAGCAYKKGFRKYAQCNCVQLPSGITWGCFPNPADDSQISDSPTYSPTSFPSSAPTQSPTQDGRTLYFANNKSRDQQAGILTGGGRGGIPIESLLKKDIKGNSCVLVSDNFTAPFNSQLDNSFYYFTSEAYLPVQADPNLIVPKYVDGETCNMNSINMIMSGGECSGLSEMPKNACVIVIS